MTGKYGKLLIFWGALFVLSLFFIFTGFGASFFAGSEGSNGLDKPTVDPEGPDKPVEES
jgi:hypothetical protein